MDKGKAIGIDLGTTYSCVAAWQHDRVEIIVNEQGNRTTPSVVAFTPSERLLGDAAKSQVSYNPQNTVFDAKRLIGRQFHDPCVQSDMKHWPFTVVAANNGQPIIQVDYKDETKQFAAEEISSMILVKMKTIAEEFLGCDVKKAVITVPAYFNNSQRRATKDAAKIAGINLLRIINEPTAAAIAYGFGAGLYKTNEKKTILVFDLGGGTFDVSVLVIQGVNFKVKVVGGATHLGGEDFDSRLLNHCIDRFNRKNKKEMNTSAKAVRRLRSECEKAKRTLSSATETVIDIDCFYEGLDFHLKITRAKFEELNADLFEKCMQIVKQCLEDAKLSNEQIDDVVLVGGSSRIPKVQELLQELLQGKRLSKTVNPDEAVAHGAAVHAAALNNEEVHLVLEDVTPLSLGISADAGVMSVVVPRNTPLPTRKEEGFTTSKDNQLSASFRVYEGERALTADNNFLGGVVLEGIPAARCDVPNLKVAFEVDVDGILKVSARDEASGVSNSVTINYPSDRLSEEIEQMLNDAEKFQKDDEEAKKRSLAKSNLEKFIYNMRSRMKEGRKKMDSTVAADIDKNLNIAAEWLEENENPHVDEMEEKLKGLNLKCSTLKQG